MTGSGHDARLHLQAKEAADERPESTLLPMLITGLVLIVVGAVVVMNFV